MHWRRGGGEGGFANTQRDTNPGEPKIKTRVDEGWSGTILTINSCSCLLNSLHGSWWTILVPGFDWDSGLVLSQRLLCFFMSCLVIVSMSLCPSFFLYLCVYLVMSLFLCVALNTSLQDPNIFPEQSQRHPKNIMCLCQSQSKGDPL